MKPDDQAAVTSATIELMSAAMGITVAEVQQLIDKAWVEAKRGWTPVIIQLREFADWHDPPSHQQKYRRLRTRPRGRKRSRGMRKR